MARMVCCGWRRSARVGLLLSGLLLLIGCALTREDLTVAFQFSPTNCFIGQAIEFDASASYGGGDDITEYAWRFGDGAAAQGRVVVHTFASPREYIVELTITSSGGRTATASRRLQIQRALLVPSMYRTIQAAIDAASDGDTVLVLPGMYTESLRIMKKGIALQSADPHSSVVVQSTTIRGAEYGRPTISLGNGTTSTVAGFTILPGPDDLISGPCDACAGMVYIREASPTIRLNRILDSPNTGIGVYESKAHIEYNTISGNSLSGGSGGGIIVDSYRVAPIITGNTFENNSAKTGGAIFINATAVVILSPACAAATIMSQNSFISNVATAGYGGAIFVEYTGNLRLDTPDSNTYTGNGTNPVHYVVPP